MPEQQPEGGIALALAITELVVEVRLARIAQETIAQGLGEMTGMVGALLARVGMQGVPGLQDGAGNPPGR